MSVSLVSNLYLDENSTKIRSKLVPWEGYQRAELVTSEELALIKKVDRQPRAKMESILVSDGQIYALLYLRLLKKLQRVDTMQCLLVLIADALLDHDERIPLFTRAVQSDPDLPYLPLLRTLEAQDDFVQLKSAQILTILLSSESTPLQHQHLQPFLKVLAALVQGQSSNKREVAVQCLEALLARPDSRRAVWGIPGIVAGLVEILRHKPSPQMSYQVIFCLWLLTFEQDVAAQINNKFDIVPLLISVAQTAAKEKVIRVIIATFRNLITKAPSVNFPAMLVAQLLPFSKNLCARKFSDEDILEDVQFVRDELEHNFESLTTYDEYVSELASGHLSWTPVHESDEFWRENASKLNEKDYEQLKILIGLLNTEDPLVLAVAVHDLGQYVKHCERGKKAITDLGAKARAMELMKHPNQKVRYCALVTVQHLVSHSWTTV
ncbi:ATPase V1 complex subunit H [Chiua virens]|nr:ATPase V1 complex subunit H [Chiua virens]